MPVAILYSDAVNSADQFVDRALKGDTASCVTSQSNPAASLVSKDRKSSEDDFNAVLSLLLNAGVPPLHAPVLAVNMETKAAYSGADSDTVGNPGTGSVGQLLAQGRDSAPQQVTASRASATVAAALSENASTVESAESTSANGLNPANTTVTAITSAMKTSAESQAGQGGVSSQLTGKVKGFPEQVQPIIGAVEDIDAAGSSVKESVPSLPPDLVAAKPLSMEIVQALERIGRPPEPQVIADERPQPMTASTRSATYTPQNLGLSSGESQASADSILSLKSTSAAESTTTSRQSTKGTTEQPVTQSSDLKKFVSGPENSPPSTATFIRSLSSRSAEAKTGMTAAIESSRSTPDSAVSATDLMTAANEQLQRSVGSVNQDSLKDTDTLASDRPESQARSVSDLASAAIQSGLVSSVSPNSGPDLAASISAEMRQPLTSQVSQAIMDHVERTGVRQNDSLSVRLDPPELGELTIQLSKTHEGLAVRVTAREAVTMDMLFARGQEIESQLRGQHMNLKSLEFYRADVSNSGFSHGQGQPRQQNNSSRRSEILLNPVRSGIRALGQVSTGVRSATPDSLYGLSFTA